MAPVSSENQAELQFYKRNNMVDFCLFKNKLLEKDVAVSSVEFFQNADWNKLKELDGKCQDLLKNSNDVNDHVSKIKKRCEYELHHPFAIMVRALNIRNNYFIKKLSGMLTEKLPEKLPAAPAPAPAPAPVVRTETAPKPKAPPVSLVRAASPEEIAASKKRAAAIESFIAGTAPTPRGPAAAATAGRVAAAKVKLEAAQSATPKIPEQVDAAKVELEKARVAVFKDTQEITEKTSKKPISSLITSNAEFKDPYKGKSTHVCKLKIINQDCLIAAQEHFKKTNRSPCIVNAANAHCAGGGIEKGSMAQEEEIMRRSTAYAGLTTIDKETVTSKSTRYGGRQRYNKDVESALLRYGCIFTDNITALKDKEYILLPPDQQFTFSAIATAAYKLSDRKEVRDDKLANSDGSINYTEYERRMHNKIKKQILTAIKHNQKDFMPAALGCGAFVSFEENEGKIDKGYTTKIIANIYREILVKQGLGKYFKTITFPILDGPKADHNSNCAIFQQAFGMDVNVGLNKGSERELDLSKVDPKPRGKKP